MSIIQTIKEIYDLMFHNNYETKPDTSILYFSQKTGKYYNSNTEYDAILLKGKRGTHDHGGKIPTKKFNFMRKQRVKVVFASRMARWWIKFPGCNGCSLKTNVKEGKDFDFL